MKRMKYVASDHKTRPIFSCLLSLITTSGWVRTMLVGLGMAAGLLPITSTAQDQTSVHVDGVSIVYIGALTEEANEQAYALLTPSITTLKIDSEGGDVRLGMDLGDWIQQYKLDVEVLGLCFSSCANYIFPSGNTKILGLRNIVGWHGGATEKPSLEFAEQLLKFKPDQLVGVIQYLNNQLVRETLFFNRIKVDQALTVHGQQAKYKSQAEGCKGWSYSLNVMRAFGIRNIALKNGAWSPRNTYKGGCLFSITST
ncbi:hypothetical protein SAMN05216570_2135 [Dyella sp. OK004]|uniref:hypothetical protein n=1 Tax=Dyella sp. OK004 TaxID=1855292 RepID=UPI0008F2A6FA|nr:hypothetical protein [Dyella sp. OK004]SFS06389.1 hypothetical protein SAMN05216570_2135 [Dyella sp. OK004]